MPSSLAVPPVHSCPPNDTQPESDLSPSTPCDPHSQTHFRIAASQHHLSTAHHGPSSPVRHSSSIHQISRQHRHLGWHNREEFAAPQFTVGTCWISGRRLCTAFEAKHHHANSKSCEQPDLIRDCDQVRAMASLQAPLVLWVHRRVRGPQHL